MYAGLTPRHAAILYVGFKFYDEARDEEIAGLIDYLESKNKFSCLYHSRWKGLYKAIKSGDLKQIMKFTSYRKSDTYDTPDFNCWPTIWKYAGNYFERVLYNANDIYGTALVNQVNKFRQKLA